VTSPSGPGGERAVPFYCPYCGDEDLRPSEESHGAWECAACNRAFQLKFLGLLSRGVQREERGGAEI
jgi:transposase-like protein